VKILVTGATGFLGLHLVEKLLDAGHQVRALGRTKPTHPVLQRTEYIRGDLKDRDAVRAALQGVDAVYHLAGLVSFRPRDGRKMFELHVDCTRELLRDIRDSGQKPRIILASTSGTIAVSKTERVGTEADDYPITVVGTWPYYLSKIYEEKLSLEFCKKNGLPLVVLNPSLLMGPGDERLSSTWTVAKFLNGELPSLPGGGMSFVDVRDAADAFVAALTRGDMYGRHLLGVNMTMDEFFGRISRLSGVAPPMLKLPSAANVLGAKLLEKVAEWRGTEAALDPQEVEIGEHWFWLDASKAEAELGFKARDVQETLHDTVQFILSRTPPQSLPGVKGKLWEMRNG
jgi:dihydroflavonol-4-reductase